MTDLEEVRPTEPEDETIAPTERCDEEEAWPGPEPGEYVLAPAPPSAPSTEPEIRVTFDMAIDLRAFANVRPEVTAAFMDGIAKILSAQEQLRRDLA